MRISLNPSSQLNPHSTRANDRADASLYLANSPACTNGKPGIHPRPCPVFVNSRSSIFPFVSPRISTYLTQTSLD